MNMLAGTAPPPSAWNRPRTRLRHSVHWRPTSPVWLWAVWQLDLVALIRENSLYMGAASAGPRFAVCISVLRPCRLSKIDQADYLAAVTPKLIDWGRRRRAGHQAPGPRRSHAQGHATWAGRQSGVLTRTNGRARADSVQRWVTAGRNLLAAGWFVIRDACLVDIATSVVIFQHHDQKPYHSGHS